MALIPNLSDPGKIEKTFSAVRNTGTIHISPRYHRWHVDPGVEWLESNTTYGFLDWEIPVENTGLVLLDVWQRHYLKDTEERTEQIIDNNVVPLLESCRKQGMKIIHAPSLNVAKKYENWFGKNLEIHRVSKETWPPDSFKNKTGKYEKYARPFEVREEERRNLPPLVIHPKVGPREGETVVGTGHELHEYCRENGILFLFYVGFNTNACMITRDYSPLAMSKKGYEIILIRDCTTAMESAATHESLAQTKNSILFFEMFGQYTVTSLELTEGFRG